MRMGRLGMGGWMVVLFLLGNNLNLNATPDPDTDPSRVFIRSRSASLIANTNPHSDKKNPNSLTPPPSPSRPRPHPAHRAHPHQTPQPQRAQQTSLVYGRTTPPSHAPGGASQSGPPSLSTASKKVGSCIVPDKTYFFIPGRVFRFR